MKSKSSGCIGGLVFSLIGLFIGIIVGFLLSAKFVESSGQGPYNELGQSLIWIFFSGVVGASIFIMLWGRINSYGDKKS
ncbi:MAG: hypothetical protein COB60_11160 [Flavobacteriaceae bacterium]|nr:MAG: hypothetical protein COB60_11160 [Flavobacteriaceae bacterium]